MAYGTVNADVIGTSVTGSNLGAGNASIMKNRIINGAMVIDQRNAGASVTPADSAYTLDRWKFSLSQASKLTCQQNAGAVTTPAGFVNYLGITSSSAYTVGSGENFNLVQNIEGLNIADLGWGTANAKTVTISFQVYSSLTGTFGGSIENSSYNRSYPFSYSIPVANTWTSISITVAGDTSGSWLTTNGVGIRVQFGLGVGSTVSGTAGAWAGADYRSATGATSVVGTNGATFYITGVQLEVGTSATGFEYVNYQTSLANCQRYYEQVNIITSNETIVGQAQSSTSAFFGVPLKVTKRTAPTGTITGTIAIVSASGAGLATTSTSIVATSVDNAKFQAVVSSGISAGQATMCYGNGAATINFSAEL